MTTNREGWLKDAEEVHDTIWGLLPGLPRESPAAKKVLALERMALAALERQDGVREVVERLTSHLMHYSGQGSANLYIRTEDLAVLLQALAAPAP